MGEGNKEGLWLNSQGTKNGTASQGKEKWHRLDREKVGSRPKPFSSCLGHEIYANWLTGKMVCPKIKHTALI